jgi:hypothetical protein
MTFLFNMPSPLVSSILLLGVTTMTTVATQPQPQQVRSPLLLVVFIVQIAN